MVANSRDQAIRSVPADTVFIHAKQGPPSGIVGVVFGGLLAFVG